MTHAQKPDFVFRRNGRVHLNRCGRQFSRLLVAEVCASAVVMLDTQCSEVVWEYWLPTPIASFPFTSSPVGHRVLSHFNWSLQRNETDLSVLVANCRISFLLIGDVDWYDHKPTRIIPASSDVHIRQCTRRSRRSLFGRVVAESGSFKTDCNNTDRTEHSGHSAAPTCAAWADTFNLFQIWYEMIHLLTAVGLSPGGSSTVHIYTQTIHRTTQWNRIPRTEHT